MPALPLDEAGKYVAGAYVVFMLLILIYVGIMAAKLQRIERELRELASFAEQGANGKDTSEGASRSDSPRPSEIVAVGSRGEPHTPAADAERSTRAESDG